VYATLVWLLVYEILFFSHPLSLQLFLSLSNRLAAFSRLKKEAEEAHVQVKQSYGSKFPQQLAK
jgi:hypothetical protein